MSVVSAIAVMMVIGHFFMFDVGHDVGNISMDDA